VCRPSSPLRGGRAASPALIAAPEIALRGITRRFGTTLANDRIDLRFQPASIHALIGENGAGKSTLMRILFGLLRPDAGEVRIGGRSVELGSPAEALRRGIGMIHQHFMLVPPMTVLENVILGYAGLRGLRALPRAELAERFRRLVAAYGFDLESVTSPQRFWPRPRLPGSSGCCAFSVKRDARSSSSPTS